MTTQVPQASPSGRLDLVQLVAGEVPAELPFVRFHVAKLFVSMLLFRVGLGADEVAGFFPGVDLQQLSMEYSAILDSDRMGAWFVDALDRFEPEARRCVGKLPVEFVPA